MDDHCAYIIPSEMTHSSPLPYQVQRISKIKLEDADGQLLNLSFKESDLDFISIKNCPNRSRRNSSNSTSGQTRSSGTRSDSSTQVISPALFNEGGEKHSKEIILFTDYSSILPRTIFMTKVSHKTRKRIEFITDISIFSFSYRQVSKVKKHDFSIDDIRHVSERELACHFREELGLSQECERRWVSMTYFDHNKQMLKCLHLVTDTSHDLKRLLCTIKLFRDMKETFSKSYLIDLPDLSKVKYSIMVEGLETIEKEKKLLLLFEDVLKYCKKLDINLIPAQLRVFFDAVKAPDQMGLDFEAFKRFVTLLRYRHDLAGIYKNVGCRNVMDSDLFRNFICNIQKEAWLTEELEKVFRKYCSDQADSWSIDDFNQFLNSRYLSYIKEPFRAEGYYTHPLNEYFILSSHNTYLQGRQFAGESSVPGYIRALQRGCRCLEIDIWNNTVDDTLEPIVNHGRTFSKGIKLSDVLLTIKKFAFDRSNLPVILSLEIHCSIPAQKIAVDVLKRTFGSSLVLSPLTKRNVLPSPVELLNKVLIKVKRTDSELNSVDDTGSFTTCTTGTSFSESTESFVPRSSLSEKALKLRKRKTTQICKELSNLGIYCQGLKFRNFSLPESKTYNHCFSMSEKAINSMLKDPMTAEYVDKHNRRFFMRVYPSKFRLSSSNFIPLNYWAHGVQIVATNWQTYDLGQQLNEAFFDSVAGNGFILKPLDLRRPTLKSTMRNFVEKTSKNQIFTINVISAQQLHRPLNLDALNPYVSFEILGAESVLWNEQSSLSNTKVFAGNGFNPIWNEEFSGSFLHSCELVFVRLTIYTSASPTEPDLPKEIGSVIFNIFNIKQGYRYLRLRDCCGELLLHSTLFVQINV